MRHTSYTEVRLMGRRAALKWAEKHLATTPVTILYRDLLSKAMNAKTVEGASRLYAMADWAWENL